MLEVFRLGRRRRAKRCSRAGESGSKLPYLFSAPTENSPGARDLSRRNAGKADPRLEISRPRRRPIFLRTKVRAPFARPADTLNTYSGLAERLRAPLNVPYAGDRSMENTAPRIPAH